MKTAKRS